jgi:hypothetical protein
VYVPTCNLPCNIKLRTYLEPYALVNRSRNVVKFYLLGKCFCEKKYGVSEIVPKQGVFAYDSGRDTRPPENQTPDQFLSQPAHLGSLKK